MRIKLILASFLILSVLPQANAERRRRSYDDVYVGGYERKDGTYVEPYYRSKPNAQKWDNYGYEPSQPQYNPPQPNRSNDWYKPNPGRYNDNNPYNDSPYGR